MTAKIAPSILTADVGRLAEQVQEAASAGVEYLHLDVMDGQFVPVISFGPMFVAAVRKAVDLTLDIHLMVERPEDQIAAFRDAGGDIINFHVEASRHPHRLASEVRRLGAQAGISVNPGTPIESVQPLLTEVDQVMIMGVNPGWGGQSFIESTVDKVAALRSEITKRGLNVAIEVDGGIGLATGPRCVAAGADVLVAGSLIYNEKPLAENVSSLRAAIAQAASKDPR